LAAARLLLESKCDISNLVVIFPGSGSPVKNWPVDKFAALASMLASEAGILPLRLRSGLRLADADSALNDTRRTALNDTRRPRAGPPAPLSATSDDARHSAVVVIGPAEAGIEPVFREAGVPVLKDLDLPTVAAIASIASAFVANDSGVAHLAAAVGASGVVIFGHTDPARWRPMGSGQIDVLRREPIDSIETREVAGALLKFVERGQR
jgi:ADP-heptose:LPS heptosyltransferase